MLLGLLLALLLIPSVPGKRGHDERERGQRERGRGGGEADWRREQERRREQEEYEEYEYEYQQQEQQGQLNSHLQVILKSDTLGQQCWVGFGFRFRKKSGFDYCHN